MEDSPRPLPESARAAAGVVGLVALVFYGWGAAPFPTLLDSAELATASFGLGVAHPPGEPLALLWGRAFAFLPFGNVTWRVAFGQGVAASLAAALVVLLASRLIDTADEHQRIGHGARAVLAAGAGLAFALAPGVVLSSVRVEVYALVTALAVGALVAALEARARHDARWALLAALLIGLGVATHPLVAGLAGVGAVVGALPLWLRDPAGAGRVRFLLASCAALALGLAVNLYDPLRASALFQAADAGIDNIVWGDARTLAGFWWLVSARTFAAKAGVVHGASEPGSLPFVFIDELGFVALALALLGLYGVLRRSAGARASVVALGVTIAGAVAAALAGGFDPTNPDIRGYLGVAWALTPILATLGAATLMSFVRGGTRRQAVVVAVFVLANVARSWPQAVAATRRNARAADIVTGALLSQLPARTALVTGYFETGFLVAYQRLVEGRRPDVTWAHLAFGRGPGMIERVARGAPDLLPVFTAHARGDVPLAALNDVATKRPVALDAIGAWADDVPPALRFTGLSWTLGPHAARAPTWPLDGDVAQEAERDPQTSGFLLFRRFVDASFACRAHATDARTRVEALARERPDDARVADLVRTCAP